MKSINGTTTQNLSFGFNANGDRTQQTDSVTGTQTSFGYDQANRLTSWTSGSTNASYVYDGDGLRASKTVNGTGEAFVYDLAEGMPLIIGDGTTKYLTGPGGLPLEQVTGTGGVLYYVQDQLGSTRGLIDGSGNVAATYTYGAYGELRGQTGTASNPFGYAGQYKDSESGLQYLRARYYDPTTDQFLSVDPLVDMTGEVYAYTAGNPLNGNDPSGLGCSSPWNCVEEAAAWTSGKVASGASWASGHTLDLGRQAAIVTLNGAINFIGITHSDLTSGNPLEITLGVGYVYANVFLAGYGIEGEGLIAGGEDLALGGAGCPGAVDAGSTVIYRGVAEDHHAFEDALQGTARPGDPLGHANPILHNQGITDTSRLTSWTTSLAVAGDYAEANGVILRTTIAEMLARGVNIIASPDRYREGEVLLEGIIKGLEVLRA